jgi:hypothetical protein
MNKTWLGITMIVLTVGNARADSWEALRSYFTLVECGLPAKEATIKARTMDCAFRNPYRWIDYSATKNRGYYLTMVAQIESYLPPLDSHPWYTVVQVHAPGKPIDGLLIGDRHERPFTWDEAQTVCGSSTLAEGLIPHLNWRLMTADEQAYIASENDDEYEKATNKHIKGNHLVFDLSYVFYKDFWSSTKFGTDRAWLLQGDYRNGLCPDCLSGAVSSSPRQDHAHVRCVADPPKS